MFIQIVNDHGILLFQGNVECVPRIGEYIDINTHRYYVNCIVHALHNGHWSVRVFVNSNQEY